MRWSQTFVPTLKETPAEAEIASHKLLLRAGLIRKLAGGLYTFLPMGLRALQKISQIIREEMNRAGALEILMPALQPPEIWKESGRYETASDVLFKAKDRANREWVLGPTHEEVVTTLAAGEISSYRQLPKNYYQIQTKFRDEIRPRFGLMRAREFIMKDAYSFDTSDEAAQASYQGMFDAYVRIFDRCGLKALPVEADTGVIGGKFSHEFMVPAEVGENDVVYVETGEYAANVEKATSALKSPLASMPSLPLDQCPPAEPFETPGVRTIEDLTRAPYSVEATRQIKTLVYVVEDKPVILLLLGNDQLNESKVAGLLGTTQFRPAESAEIHQWLGAHPGSLGAVGIGEIPIYADCFLEGGQDLVTGANQDGYHLKHVCVARDIRIKDFVDLRTVQAGEPCPVTGKPLQIQTAIEVGHVFKLGTKYSEAMQAQFLDEHGKSQPCVMGCYGIGVTRTLQAVIEQCHDEHGIYWPPSVAPYVVCITPLGVKPESEVMRCAEDLYQQLSEAGVDVILDDRDERPGVKFKDSELIGFPLRIGIGERSLKEGEVEIKPRKGELLRVKTDQAVPHVLDWLNSEASRPAS
ncbi:MAG: proline--tRNA ligase [Verrucomicrobia bacterium]|nr:proline--tRNA ligase [Verrucomicrobiota bacterium]